ncbi:DUF2203 domain-containing protein [Candidatus Chrysopegis kryptomonas]|jgi:hypothetical protein|uniref:DUF2203 domain-containing protein n=1 Tax=Candidatus Chryseopegocella kryptomonas TaxID=1633643 RepID=A0A0P1NUI3_9BACT|nr:DUF2203 domain-containing protein [Candidatus Chrysopegis kryptomonas]CUT02592.1 hypothetical protein JGI23_01284 [Candidatus Chrysopegis kryptomonas]
MKYLHEKHFTIEEARNLLSEIKPLVERMTQLKKILDIKGYDIYRHRYFTGGPNGEKNYPVELEELIAIIERIESMGALVKGIEQGLIDFPHIRENGQEVYLCWMHGEDTIKFWHTISEGFMGRKPIEEI